MVNTRINSMTKSSAYFAEARRYRQPVDAAYLNALAVRLADAARLPLRVAKARVKQLSVSATAKPAPGRPRCSE